MGDKSAAKLKRLHTKAQAFLDETSFVTQGEKALTPGQKFILFWVMVGKSFAANRCPVRASALAYTTLLALVPMLAVGIGISAQLLKKEGQKPVEELINRVVSEVAPQLGLIPSAGANTEEGARAEVVRRITDFIANVHSGTLGVTGTVAIILIAIGLLGTIEKTFNDIWGVQRSRNWFSSIVLYWTAITLGPMFIILAISLTVGRQFQAIQARLQAVPFLGEFIFVMAPIFILIGAFTLFYLLMPNTKVDWRAALVGGFVGGVLWSLNSQFNVIFASRVITASKIYGPLGTVPVFLIGMYFSWLILLFGAQVAYAYQNRRTYLQEKQAETVNQRGREFIALRLMTRLGQRFQKGESPLTATELAEALEVPTRLVSRILGTLAGDQLLVEVAGPETAYAPARPLASITARHVLDAMRAGQGQELATQDEPERALIRQEFDRIRAAEQAAAASVTVEMLVGQTGAERTKRPAGD